MWDVTSIKFPRSTPRTGFSRVSAVRAGALAVPNNFIPYYRMQHDSSSVHKNTILHFAYWYKKAGDGDISVRTISLFVLTKSSQHIRATIITINNAEPKSVGFKIV